MRKGKDMNYIELESNGTALYENGMTYSINVDGTHDTYELSGVHILDTDDEWWYSLSMEDALLLFPFLDTEFLTETGKRTTRPIPDCVRISRFSHGVRQSKDC